MIKALLLIFRPASTWDGIDRAQRGVGFVLLLYVVPLLLLTSAVEGFGLVQWGKMKGVFPRLQSYAVSEAAAFELLQIFVLLLIVLVGAVCLRVFAHTFHARHSFREAFAVVAYGLGPFFLSRFMDASPWLSVWVSWAIGILFTISTLYHGVPRVMRPDPPHAFGLYLMGSVLLFFMTGLWRFLIYTYFHDRFPAFESLVSSLAARLPF